MNANEIYTLCETYLSDLGDQFEKTVLALQTAGFMITSCSKGGADQDPMITLDDGRVVKINRENGSYTVSENGHKPYLKQRLFSPSVELIALLKAVVGK